MIRNSAFQPVSQYFKSDSKFPALNRKIDAICWALIRFLRSHDCDRILKVLWSKSLLASNPKGLREVDFSPRGKEMSKFEI